MLGSSSSYSRRGPFPGSTTTATSSGSPTTFPARSRPPFKSYAKAKPSTSFSYQSTDPMGLTKAKRLKARRINGFPKMDVNKKKAADYTEMAYREAVSKLKYLLAESYAPKMTSEKFRGIGNIYRESNSKVNEFAEDTDDRSMISDYSKAKDIPVNLPSTTNSYSVVSKSFQPVKAHSNLALSPTDLQSVPPEVTSFIEKQEEYIEQLERESHYCKDELTNLLSKVREVVAENEALHNKNKSGFFKSVLEDHKGEHRKDIDNFKHENTEPEFYETQKSSLKRVLEGPSIVFESRISELEAQLTQAKLELRKMQEESQANAKRLCENCLNNGGPEVKVQLEQALKLRYEVESKLEEMHKTLAAARDKESEAMQKAKRASDLLQQIEFDKSQADKEVRRLKEELERQHEKIREMSQEASRRISEERQQVERRYSQQVEQLSTDVASHWDAANKSQLESERQRREIADLKRELAQKQSIIDNLKKDLQNKISSLQTDLNQALTEKDGAEQEILATKLAAERSERQARQEQSRLQTEINSYKQRLERADADILHCRRENLRLSEQIASLEKEINMSKISHPEENRPQNTPRIDNEKELTSMVMDMESKHAATVAGLEDALSNQTALVLRLTSECQSLTQRMEANDLKHKEEMASLQSNIEYLSSKVQDMINSQQDSTMIKNDNDFLTKHDLNESFKPEEQMYSLSKDQNAIHEPLEREQESAADLQRQQQEHVFDEQQQLSETGLGRTDTDTLQESEIHNREEEEKYESGNQGLESYPEQQYNQYDQYNPSEYQEQQYGENSQYEGKEMGDGGQYYTEEQTNSTDSQYAHS